MDYLRQMTGMDESRSDQTARLFAERRTADATRRAGIDDALIRLNMKVAVDATRRFRGRGIATDDLQQMHVSGEANCAPGLRCALGRSAPLRPR